MPAYVTQSDLEDFHKPSEVVRVFTDDGGATINTARLDAAIARGSGIADAILARAWKDAASRAKMAEDPAVKGAIADLVMGYGMNRKPEWRREGKGAGDGLIRDAKDTLTKVAAAKLRPAKESEAGANPTVKSRTNLPQEPQFIFAPTSSNPRPGGY